MKYRPTMFVMAVCVVGMAAMVLRADPPATAPAPQAAALALLTGRTFDILPQTHDAVGGRFSLAQGLDGRLYVGTGKHGENAYVVELNPATGAQRVVIDTNQVCNLAPRAGVEAQAEIGTRIFVAPSGQIYAGSCQGEVGKDENPSAYAGGFLMSYDPRVDAAKSYGMVPYHGFGVVDIAADEARNLIYYVCANATTGDHLWGVYDTVAKKHQLLVAHVAPGMTTLMDATGHAFVLTSDHKLASYNADGHQISVRDIVIEGEANAKKSFDPAVGAAGQKGRIAWVATPDGQAAYLIVFDRTNLYRINLGGAGKTTMVADLGSMDIPHGQLALKVSSVCLTLHPDGSVYALLLTVSLDSGRQPHDVDLLVRYEPKTKAMLALGDLAINTKLVNGPGLGLSVVTGAGLIAARDGTVYVQLAESVGVMQLNDFRLPPEVAAPPSPARQWTDVALGLCDHTEKELPEITRIAEAVAKRYEAGGRLDVLLNTNNGWPGQGPECEISGRSGGMMNLGARYMPDPEDTTRPAAEQANDVIIIGWQRAPSHVRSAGSGGTGPDTNPTDMDRIKLYQKRGAKVLGFGPRELPELAAYVKACDYWINSGAPGTGDLAITLPDGRRVGRFNTLANMLDAWTFVAEFVAACTRDGKMPPMWKAMLWKNDWEPWMNKYMGKQRFHDDLFVPPIAPGVLGRRFLDQIRWHMRKFQNTQLEQVHRAADIIVAEHAKGRKTVVTVAGHCMFDTVGKYEDEAWAQEISFHGWVPYETRAYVAQAPRDALVLDIAYCGMHKEQWSTFIGAGQNRILLITSPNNSQEYPELDGPRDECLAVIDMGHTFGDACTRIEGYPVPVFPPSGIMQAVAYEAVDTEVLAKIPWVDGKPKMAVVGPLKGIGK